MIIDCWSFICTTFQAGLDTLLAPVEVLISKLYFQPQGFSCTQKHSLVHHFFENSTLFMCPSVGAYQFKGFRTEIHPGFVYVYKIIYFQILVRLKFYFCLCVFIYFSDMLNLVLACYQGGCQYALKLSLICVLF